MRFGRLSTSVSFRIVLKAVLLLLYIFLPASVINGQSTDRRPRVGLVLSGGGALGMAHTGVLKVMEEAGLRPDYITGVSMGSIVGGMYSIGYSADSLYKLIRNTNWDLVFSKKIPEYIVAFPEKKYLNNSIVTLPVTLKKVKLPSGLINGQHIENILSYYAWPAADINDFSKLPIPFMCVATNIVTCKIVDLTGGYLPDAIRASIAVPSIFTPIKVDSLLLLDGGIVRNFAASEVKAMGADIVIGSYTGRMIRKEEDLQSVTEIMEQLAFYNGLYDFAEQKKLVDLLIEPDLKGLKAINFQDADSIIERGYRAAVPHREYFRKLADSLNRITPQEPLKSILTKRTFSFDKIEINGNKVYSDNQIKGVLDIKPGQKVDQDLMKEKMELLYSKVWFEKVKYRFIKRNDSLILAIDCIEKPRATLYGSVNYNESLKTGLILRFSAINLFTDRSVFDIDAFVGKYYRFRFDWLQFIDKNQKYGLSPDIYIENTLLPMMELNGVTSDLISRNYYYELEINRRLGLNNMVSITGSYDMLNLIPAYPSTPLPLRSSYNYLTLNWGYKCNTLDTKHFPNKGIILNLAAGTSKLYSAGTKTDSVKSIYKESTDMSISPERFYTVSGNIRKYFSTGKKVSYSLGVDALYMTGSDTLSEKSNYYMIGGLYSINRRSVPMIGFHYNEIAVRNLAGVSAEIDVEVIENLHLNVMASFCAASEVKKADGFSFLTGFGIGAGYMSVIGPLRIGIMHGQYTDEKFFNQIKGFISFGYTF